MSALATNLLAYSTNPIFSSLFPHFLVALKRSENGLPPRSDRRADENGQPKSSSESCPPQAERLCKKSRKSRQNPLFSILNSAFSIRNTFYPNKTCCDCTILPSPKILKNLNSRPHKDLQLSRPRKITNFRHSYASGW